MDAPFMCLLNIYAVSHRNMSSTHDKFIKTQQLGLRANIQSGCCVFSSAQGNILLGIPGECLAHMVRFEIRPIVVDHIDIRVHRLYRKEA